MNKYIIKIDKLCKKYDEDVLKNVKLNIAMGDSVGIVGKSGNGKSTLLKCINRLINFDKGDIYYNNININDIDQNELREDIGIVFQDYNLFDHLTVLENLTIALIKVKKMNKEEANNEALDMLKQYGLLNKKNNYPYELSGGQKQRVAIIRTLLMNPKVLMLDEPTSSLDEDSKKEIIQTIKGLTKNNITLIIVSHEEKVIKKLCNKVFELTNLTLKEVK